VSWLFLDHFFPLKGVIFEADGSVAKNRLVAKIKLSNHVGMFKFLIHVVLKISIVSEIFKNVLKKDIFCYSRDVRKISVEKTVTRKLLFWNIWQKKSVKICCGKMKYSKFFFCSNQELASLSQWICQLWHFSSVVDLLLSLRFLSFKSWYEWVTYIKT